MSRSSVSYGLKHKPLVPPKTARSNSTCACDCAVPPLRELVARIRAVHRRATVRAEPQNVSQPTPILKVGPISISALHRTVHTEDGRRLALTSAEFSALEMLAGAAGAAVSRDELSLAALRRPWRAEDRSVDQLVFNLRQKLPVDGDGGMLIQSIRGCGYWMRAPETMMRGRNLELSH